MDYIIEMEVFFIKVFFFISILWVRVVGQDVFNKNYWYQGGER